MIWIIALTKGHFGWDLDFFYKEANYNLYGQYYVCTQELDDSTSYVWSPYKGSYLTIGGNYAVNKKLVIGANISQNNYDDGCYETWTTAGLTYKINDRLSLDGRYNYIESDSDDNQHFGEVMMTYQCSDNLKVGVYTNSNNHEDVDYYEDDYEIGKSNGIKAIYAISDKAQLNLSLQLYEPTALDLSYVVKL